eukprot:TRINITY_DN1161_c0_g1_i11.p1 TRINITY_DN1161_c0_g1~~TRINITY_DN1161_c0_g1_i11.p1  ORF type:complete len:484 (+),score=93.55 TRINITY_DN1161_c0_g1_i11:2851-4302(+)
MNLPQMESLCVCRIGPSGELVLFDQDSQMASVGFGMHGHGWSPKRPTLVSASPFPGHTCERLGGDGVTVTSLHSVVKGYTGTLNLTTFMVTTGNGVELELHATPAEDEEDVCSVRLSVDLPVKYWGEGKVSLNTTFSLAKEGDPIVDNSSMFGVSPKVSSIQTVDKFSFNKKGVTLTISTLETLRCNFVDLRQWVPSFEVRVGDSPSGFTWKKGDTKRWYARVEASSPSLIFDDPFSTTLTREEKLKFKNDGYIHIPNLIKRSDVNKALRCVNQAIKAEGAEDFSSKFTGSTAITDLFNFSPIRGVLSDLLGLENVGKQWGSQIALVYPRDPPATNIKHMGHHLDGAPNYRPGVWNGSTKLNNFTTLVGIYLSDVPEPDSGNFTVFPGSHKKFEEHFKVHGPDSIIDKEGKMKLPKLDLAEPIQLCPKAGDVVLAHYMTAHTVACNVSPHIRYAIYFRVNSPLTQSQRERSLTELWSDYPGMI